MASKYFSVKDTKLNIVVNLVITLFCGSNVQVEKLRIYNVLQSGYRIRKVKKLLSFSCFGQLHQAGQIWALGGVITVFVVQYWLTIVFKLIVDLFNVVPLQGRVESHCVIQCVVLNSAILSNIQIWWTESGDTLKLGLFVDVTTS